MKPFEYYEAKDVAETLDILASGEDIRVLAGGCGILTIMKPNLYTPKALVNIKKIDELKYIRAHNGEIAIGALATHTEVRDSPIVLEKVPVLSEALGYVATARIRNMATLGGTIVHADPNSDVAPALLVLEGRVQVRSWEGTRQLPMDSVYVDLYETRIDRTDLLESILIPVPAPGSRGIYTRFQIRRSMDKAMPGVAALVELEEDNKTIRKARLAMSGVGNIPIRLKEEEDYLTGKEYRQEVTESISGMMQAKIEPLEDHHYSTEYKKTVAGVTLKRAVGEAVRRAATRG